MGEGTSPLRVYIFARLNSNKKAFLPQREAWDDFWWGRGRVELPAQKSALQGLYKLAGLFVLATLLGGMVGFVLLEKDKTHPTELSPRGMNIARVLCHPHSLVGDRAPTLWLLEEAILKVIGGLGSRSLNRSGTGFAGRTCDWPLRRAQGERRKGYFKSNAKYIREVRSSVVRGRKAEVAGAAFA